MNTGKKKCYICKNRYDRFSAIKLLKVPVDDEKRKRWSRSCGVDLPLRALVCYNHFVASDFKMKPKEANRVSLMPSAVPKPLSAFIDTSYLHRDYSCPNASGELNYIKAETVGKNLEEPLIDIVPDQTESSNLIKSCFICHKTFESDNVVLYDIPTNDKYHKLWCTKFNRYLPAETKICENHFAPNDIILNVKQENCLKLEVIPSKNLLANQEEEKAPVNILYINPKPQKEEVKLPTNPLDDGKVVEGCIMFNKIETNIRTKPNVSNKSIQTEDGCKRTCGFIEVSYDFKLFSMNCYYCNETFPIWSWGQFVSHLKEKHQKEENNYKKEEYKETKNIPQSLRYICETEFSSSSCFSNKEQSNSFPEEIKLNTLDLIDISQEITASNDLNKKTSLKDKTEYCPQIKKETNGNELNYADANESSNMLSEFYSSTDEDIKSDNENESVLKKTTKGKKPLTVPCYLCEKFFRDEAHLQAHQVMLHNVVNLPINKPRRRKLGQRQCNVCNRIFKRTNECLYHMAIHRPPEFKCHICGKDFRWKYSFELHVKLHANQRDHVCELCGASFVRPSLYVDHKKREHSDETKYACQICDYRCKTSTQLSMHRRKYHLVLEGTIEELNFNNIQEKRKHQITKYPIVVDPVTKLKRIKCDLCDLTYAHHGGLKRHRLKVHGKLPSFKKRQSQFNRNLQNNVEDDQKEEHLVRNEVETMRESFVNEDNFEDDNRLTFENNETNLVNDVDSLLSSENNTKFFVSYTEDEKNTTAEDLIDYEDTSSESKLHDDY